VHFVRLAGDLMPRRAPPSPDPRRGRHRRRGSRETHDWLRHQQSTMPPPRPEWMAEGTYRALVEMREAQR